MVTIGNSGTQIYSYLYIYIKSAKFAKLPQFLLVNIFSPWPFSLISAWDCLSWAWVCDDGSVVRQQVPVQQPPWYCSGCSVPGKHGVGNPPAVPEFSDQHLHLLGISQRFWGEYTSTHPSFLMVTSRHTANLVCKTCLFVGMDENWPWCTIATFFLLSGKILCSSSSPQKIKPSSASRTACLLGDQLCN